VSRDPRQARFLTWATLRWIVRHRAWTPWYLVRYWRFAIFKLRNPHVVTEGFVFLGRRVDVYARKGYGRLILGRWVHIGDGNAIRCHEGTLRIGDKCVFGKDNTVNAFLDIEFGAASIVADWVYICDFDHRFEDVTRPIKDQGIVKSPVRIGPDVWIGTKASVLRGVRVGAGCVIAAHALVNRDLPPYSVAVGVPARVVRNRRADYLAAATERARRELALASIARKTELAAGLAGGGRREDAEQEDGSRQPARVATTRPRSRASR
jgi:acetyltransferase-like isoleucine patch superfamily enzyme